MKSGGIGALAAALIPAVIGVASQIGQAALTPDPADPAQPNLPGADVTLPKLPGQVKGGMGQRMTTPQNRASTALSMLG